LDASEPYSGLPRQVFSFQVSVAWLLFKIFKITSVETVPLFFASAGLDIATKPTSPFYLTQDIEYFSNFAAAICVAFTTGGFHENDTASLVHLIEHTSTVWASSMSYRPSEYGKPEVYTTTAGAASSLRFNHESINRGGSMQAAPVKSDV
jgi:hypothetical protein